MMAIYNPYQKKDNIGGIMGDIGGKIISVLAMFGMSGKGPFKFLKGMGGEAAGVEGADKLPRMDDYKYERDPGPGGQSNPLMELLMKSRGQDSAPQGPQITQTGGQQPPQIQQPPPLAPMGQQGQMGGMGGQMSPEMLQRIMSIMKTFQGGPGPGGMMGGMGAGFPGQ